MIYLSILIPTLTSRQYLYKTLKDELMRQKYELEAPEEVQILSYCDNRERSTGIKRNLLLEKASGKFITFIDDDDKINPNYLKLAIKEIKENPGIDAIGIRGMYSEDGKTQIPFETSLKHNWEFKDGWFYRTINHISIVKRSHAIKVKFPDKTHGEDYEWTMALKNTGLLKKESIIKENMYFYNFISNKRY